MLYKPKGERMFSTKLRISFFHLRISKEIRLLISKITIELIKANVSGIKPVSVKLVKPSNQQVRLVKKMKSLIL